MLGYGMDIVTAKKVIHAPLDQWTPNATKTMPIFAVPFNGGSIRILRAAVICSAIPSDADGTLVLSILARDVSEAANDNIVLNADLETLVTAANTPVALTLATEGAEKELTLDPGDAIFVNMVNNSAAIDTNPFTTVAIEYINLPQRQSQNVEKFDYVNYRERY